MSKIDEEGFINNLKAARNLPNGLDITLNNAGTLLEAYKTEVASLKEEREILHCRFSDTYEQIGFLTQQLAAANGRVEKYRGRIEYVDAYLEESISDNIQLPLSDVVKHLRAAVASDLHEDKSS